MRAFPSRLEIFPPPQVSLLETIPGFDQLFRGSTLKLVSGLKLYDSAGIWATKYYLSIELLISSPSPPVTSFKTMEINCYLHPWYLMSKCFPCSQSSCSICFQPVIICAPCLFLFLLLFETVPY